jgi:hypothetical protein
VIPSSTPALPHPQHINRRVFIGGSDARKPGFFASPPSLRNRLGNGFRTCPSNRSSQVN